MMNKFWESVSSDLAKKWIEQIFGPAFFFWIGGTTIYILFESSWQEAWKWLSTLILDQNGGLLILIISLMILVLSSMLIQQLRFSILRLLEGYWPWPFRSVGRWIIQLRGKLIEKREHRWNELKRKEKKGEISPAEGEILARLETQLHYVPSDPKDYKATALGNILRSCETITGYKYGLDSYVCWPRLWLLLPETVRDDLVSVRQSLDQLIELWAWGFLFMIWAIWTPWVILISVVWMVFVYELILQTAMAYADLFESAFDLHRWILYQSLHWELPEDSESEIETGKRLTEYLWRGDIKVTYKHSDKK